MTSYINIKDKQGMNKLASLIKKAGFDGVKVTVKAKSITLTPDSAIDLSAGLSDLKNGNYRSFKSVDEGIKFLEVRSKKNIRPVSRKK